ncbi:hypothetical protein F0U60_06355 [Archangium minus]|uniref:Uncharacterized protein n=1 Tax=Archangium minus TaxID=83450 RepID=A0ABY9WIX0_9BACT|nr:hypothetical protein F0U60_06355 [Archangium minus]
MSSDLLASAVANNAAWCDAVCRAHGYPGEFSRSLWLNRAGVLEFYPNAITLTRDDVAQQLEQLSALDVPGQWGVKDSFAALDLAPRGFTELFAAQWITLSKTAPAAAPASGVRWLPIRDKTSLSAWEAAWRGPSDSHRSEQRHVLFRPALLDDANIQFFAAYDNEAIVAGAIAYRAAGVVSLSNTFFVEGAPAVLRAEMLVQAMAAFPGLRLVGYEHGDELSTWCTLGFEPVGALRVWLKRAG